MRMEALNWWRGMDIPTQMNKVKEWRNMEGNKDRRKEWPLEMIALSSSTIETIYNNLENNGSNNKEKKS